MSPLNSSSSSPCYRSEIMSKVPLQPAKKFRSLRELYKTAKRVVLPRQDYSQVKCNICGSGENDEEMLLCDGCDEGFHMMCLRPIVVRVPIGSWYCNACDDHRQQSSVTLTKFTQSKIREFLQIRKSAMKCISPLDARRHRKRSSSLVCKKKSRKLLPHIPSEDYNRRMKQMESLVSALTTLGLQYSDNLTYLSGMAPRAANQSKFETDGMQVLSKDDTHTLETCNAMWKRGKCPPLKVVYDSREGYTVEVDGPIKAMTIIAEYVGDVDYICNRENDTNDSMMTLLFARNSSKSLVICPDKRANIARFINGINNHTTDGRKKQNLKCVRYDVKGECRVFLVARRNLATGDRLYYNYNGAENAYPTDHFV